MSTLTQLADAYREAFAARQDASNESMRTAEWSKGEQPDTRKAKELHRAELKALDDLKGHLARTCRERGDV